MLTGGKLKRKSQPLSLVHYLLKYMTFITIRLVLPLSSGSDKQNEVVLISWIEDEFQIRKQNEERLFLLLSYAALAYTLKGDDEQYRTSPSIQTSYLLHKLPTCYFVLFLERVNIMQNKPTLEAWTLLLRMKMWYNPFITFHESIIWANKFVMP